MLEVKKPGLAVGNRLVIRGVGGGVESASSKVVLRCGMDAARRPHRFKSCSRWICSWGCCQLEQVRFGGGVRDGSGCQMEKD